MKAVRSASQDGSVAAICDALGVSRASYYRWLRPRHGPHRPRVDARALSEAERAKVLEVLYDDRFIDKAPGQVVATLLDEERYLCSERTMYRILEDAEPVNANETRVRLRSV